MPAHNDAESSRVDFLGAGRKSRWQTIFSIIAGAIYRQGSAPKPCSVADEFERSPRTTPVIKKPRQWSTDWRQSGRLSRTEPAAAAAAPGSARSGSPMAAAPWHRGQHRLTLRLARNGDDLFTMSSTAKPGICTFDQRQLNFMRTNTSTRTSPPSSSWTSSQATFTESVGQSGRSSGTGERNIGMRENSQWRAPLRRAAQDLVPSRSSAGWTMQIRRSNYSLA